MEAKNNIIDVLGYALFASGILIHLWFFMSNTGFYPQLFTVAISANSYEELCKMLSVIDKCEGFYAYTWALAKTPQFLVPVYQVIVVVLIFVTARKIFGSNLTAGFASFLYATTPGSLAVYSADQTGQTLAGLLIAVSALITTYGLVNEFKLQYVLVGLALYAIMLGHSATPVVLLLIAMVLLINYISDHQIDLKQGLALGLASIPALIAFIINGFKYYGLYSFPALVLSIGVALVLFLNKWMSTLSSHRAIYASILLITVVTLGLLILTTGSYRHVHVAIPNTIYLYGLPGLLSLPSVVLVFNTRKRFQVQLIATSTTALLANLFDFSIVSIALVYLTLTSCVFIDVATRFMKDLSAVNWRVKLSASVVLTTFLVVSVIGSYWAICDRATSVVVFDEITRLTSDKGLSKTHVDLMKLGENISRAVKSTATSDKVLIVAHWDYSYFLQSALVGEGLKAYSISHPYGGIQGKSLLSSIMVGNWEASKLMLRSISKEVETSDIYVFVSFAYSVSYGNNSFIGAPGSVTLESYQYPILVFDAYGDLFYTMEYLFYSNKSIENYLYVYKERPRTMALLWTTDGVNTLIAQLCVKSLLDSGYGNVYNYVIGQTPINSAVSGFELVYSDSIEVGRISITYYGDYTVYYMIALFKLVD